MVEQQRIRKTTVIASRLSLRGRMISTQLRSHRFGKFVYSTLLLRQQPSFCYNQQQLTQAKGHKRVKD